MQCNRASYPGSENFQTHSQNRLMNAWLLVFVLLVVRLYNMLIVATVGDDQGRNHWEGRGSGPPDFLEDPNFWHNVFVGGPPSSQQSEFGV